MAPKHLRADLQDILPPKAYNAAKTLVLTAGVAGMSGILLLVLFYVMSSPTFGWTGTCRIPRVPVLRFTPRQSNAHSLCWEKACRCGGSGSCNSGIATDTLLRLRICKM
jgi:hypothetical protein